MTAVEAGDGATDAIVLGLVATPGSAVEMLDDLSWFVGAQLPLELPGAAWTVRTAVERRIGVPAQLADFVAVSRAHLLEMGCNLLVLVTDLPLQYGRRPILSSARRTQGVAVVSLPALGAVQVRDRARRAVMSTVHALVGSTDSAAGSGYPHARRARRLRVRLRELAGNDSDRGDGVAFVARVATGHLHLLAGMVRANRPWALTLRLSRALTAALATMVAGLVTSDVWRLADRMGIARQALLGSGSVLAITAALIVGAQLWERSPDRAVRQQVTLLNLATAVTVVLGVAALYLAMLGLVAVGVFLVLPNSLLSEGLQHAPGLWDRLELTWLIASLATLGGALGAGLESDEAVRSAAYATRRRPASSAEPRPESIPPTVSDHASHRVDDGSGGS